METAMEVDSNALGYSEMAREAEAAVVSVKDPELRRVAFEKILQSLLDSQSTGSGQPRRKPKNTGRLAHGAAKGDSRQAPKPIRGPKAYIERLIEDNFFKKQRTIADVKAELANHGHHVVLTSLSGPLQKLTQERRLRRQKVAANGNGAKSAYAYSNW